MRLATVDLPEPDRPVNQTIAGCWPFMRGANVSVHVEGLPAEVLGTPEAEVDDTRA